MAFFQNRYYKTTRFFMLLTGLWPYQRSKIKLIWKIVICIVLISCATTQIAKLFKCRDDFIAFLDTYPTFAIVLISCIKYGTCWLNESLIVNLLEHIKYDWKMLVINDEIQLMNKYAEYGRLFAMYYILCDYPGLVAFILLQFMPAILDVFFPLDEPRPHRYPFEAEYFIDDEKYFYPILTHMIIVVTIVFTISASSDLLYITLVMHGCGALNVLGYRLEHMFDDVSITDRNETNKDEWDKFSARIKEYVKCHYRIIQYIENLNSVYAVSYFLQFVLVILILTGLLIRAFDALSSLKDLDHVILCSLHASGLYFITFMNILPAQMLLDYGEDVFYKLYFTRWYMIPFRIQKSILFMMHSCQKPYGLSILNITISLQIFAVMIQTSVSYFTVLYSLRN